MKVLKGKSGITVLFRQMKTGLVDMRYLVKVGAVDESPAEQGYCHALEHMVFAGTKKRTWLEINREWEKYGTWSNAFTGHDRTIYQTTSLKKYWKESYEVLADMIYNCQFPAERWENVEKSTVMSEIESELDDESLVLAENLYGDGVGLRYHPIAGDLGTIQNATIADLTRFYKEYYQGDNVYLLVTGDLTEKQLMGTVNWYDRLITKGPVKRKQFRFKFNYSPITIKRGGAQQAYLQTLMPVQVPRTYRTKIGLCLGVACLSQYLYEELREKRGLAYSVSASLYWNLPDQVFLQCKTATDPGKIDKVQKIFRETLDNFTEQGLSAKRINNMKMAELYAATEEQEDIDSSAESMWQAYTDGQVCANLHKAHVKLIERLSVESIRSTARLALIGKDKFGKLISS